MGDFAYFELSVSDGMRIAEFIEDWQHFFAQDVQRFIGLSARLQRVGVFALKICK